MKRRDVFVLNWLFASLYFPISTILWFIRPAGTFIAVIAVGLVFHIVLTILLVVMLWVEERKQANTEVVPKRVYKKKNKQEVKPNESEIEPTVRTDVDLNQLDADNDDIPD